ncbi:MAG: hypothetical protein MR803_08135 [Clostridiales bacterium]|nr:hypothetical protein [Clostridiales bacterium]
MNIRKLTETQKPAAMELAWRVFQEFEAPEYAPEGVQAFHDYITAPAAVKTLTVYGASPPGLPTHSGGAAGRRHPLHPHGA